MQRSPPGRISQSLRSCVGLGQSRRKSEHDDEAKDVQVPESDADTVVAAIDNARSSSFSALSAAGSAEDAAYARQLSSDNLAAMAEAPAPALASANKPAVEALADPPELELQLSETDLAVRDAQQLNDDFEWSEARRVLLPFAESDESHARCCRRQWRRRSLARGRHIDPDQAEWGGALLDAECLIPIAFARRVGIPIRRLGRRRRGARRRETAAVAVAAARQRAQRRGGRICCRR